jgi:hypothetical protein
MLTMVRMAEEANLPGKYDGVHAFAFLYEKDEVPPATVIANLRQYIDPEVGPVYSAFLFEGAFQGVAHVAEDDPRALGSLIDGPLWDAGIHSDYAAEGQWHVNAQNQPKGPMRLTPRFIAMCRVTVNRRPTQVMRNIAGFFGDEVDADGESLSPFIAASTVIAGFHLLIELGDDDREALRRHVQSLSGVDGVAGVEAAVADTQATQAP